jgi:hypothetical protein
MLKAKHFSDVEDINSIICETVLTDVPVQDFKNDFEQRPKRWEHSKELEGD